MVLKLSASVPPCARHTNVLCAKLIVAYPIVFNYSYIDISTAEPEQVLKCEFSSRRFGLSAGRLRFEYLSSRTKVSLFYKKGASLESSQNHFLLNHMCSCLRYPPCGILILHSDAPTLSFSASRYFQATNRRTWTHR